MAWEGLSRPSDRPPVPGVAPYWRSYTIVRAAMANSRMA